MSLARMCMKSGLFQYPVRRSLTGVSPCVSGSVTLGVFMFLAQFDMHVCSAVELSQFLPVCFVFSHFRWRLSFVFSPPLVACALKFSVMTDRMFSPSHDGT